MGTVDGMSSPNSPESASRGGRAPVLWGGAVLLALGATAILVLGDSTRMLRLGLLAALWSALIAGFAVARLRSRVAEDDERAEDRQRIYELELEREVTARREFELEAENEARRRVAEESDAEMQRLRAELRTLRETLEPLLGGDVLYERVALRAESTRVRSLNEQQTSGEYASPEHRGVAPSREGRALTVTHGENGGTASAARTEMIGRLGPEQKPGNQQATRRPAQARRPSPQPQQAGRTRFPSSSPSTAAANGPSRPDIDSPRFPVSEGSVAPQPAAEEPGEPAAAQQQRDSSGSAWTSQVNPGAHAQGTSVTDLLAAYGDSGEAPRRRRRGE